MNFLDRLKRSKQLKSSKPVTIHGMSQPVNNVKNVDIPFEEVNGMNELIKNFPSLIKDEVNSKDDWENKGESKNKTQKELEDSSLQENQTNSLNGVIEPFSKIKNFIPLKLIADYNSILGAQRFHTIGVVTSVTKEKNLQLNTINYLLTLEDEGNKCEISLKIMQQSDPTALKSTCEVGRLLWCKNVKIQKVRGGQL